MRQPECEGSLGGNEYLYMYGWVPLLFTWNYHINLLAIPQYKVKSYLKMTMIWDSERAWKEEVLSRQRQQHLWMSPCALDRAGRGLLGCQGGAKGRWSWKVECHGGFEAVPGSEGFILRSTRHSGGPQKQMYIVGGSSRLLWRGVEGRQGWAQRPARGFADIRLEAMGPGPASSGVVGRGDAWPGQTDAGPTGLRQTVCKREEGEALRRPLNPEQSWTGYPELAQGRVGLSLSHHQQPAPFRNQHTMAFLRLLVTKCWFPSSSKLQESNKSLTERKGSIPHHSGKKTTQNNRVAILKAIPPAFFSLP